MIKKRDRNLSILKDDRDYLRERLEAEQENLRLERALRNVERLREMMREGKDGH